jgi:hypothetical protein
MREQNTPKFEIRNLYSGEVLRTVEADSLVRADLYGADLRGADLRGADLRSADLRSADLRSADLRSADLRSADLRSADLYGANLYGVRGPWESHPVLAEILRAAAGSDPLRRMAAGLILVSPDWCWDQFLRLDLPAEFGAVREWALDTLAAYASPEDNAVPSVLRRRMRQAPPALGEAEAPDA